MRNTLERNDPTSQRQHITGPPVELMVLPRGDGKLRAVEGKETPFDYKCRRNSLSTERNSRE